MSATIKVLHYTTHNEECGIAKYQQQFISGMAGVKDIQSSIFKYSPNQTKVMSKLEFGAVMNELEDQLKDFDILHIQHEHSFYKHQELVHLVNAAHGMSKKVIFTVHTAPDAFYQKPRLTGLGPHSLVHYLRTKRVADYFENNHLIPLRLADMLIVHNEVTKQSLIRNGVNEEAIRVIRHPVPKVSFDTKSNLISQGLSKVRGDIIYCTVGFISRSKGILQAVKALNYLPKHYKLAIIGGTHPDDTDTSFYDEVTDTIKHEDLRDRVFITGYVASDDRLNAMIRECDICVYPYDQKYYSYVSSGSLNTAIANHKPVIAYPTASFKETNTAMEVINFCKSANYYELARAIQDIDINKAEKTSVAYADLFNWDTEAVKFADFYRQIATSN